MYQPVIISIEGNIGAGKTTIVQELHKRFQNTKNTANAKPSWYGHRGLIKQR